MILAKHLKRCDAKHEVYGQMSGYDGSAAVCI